MRARMFGYVYYACDSVLVRPMRARVSVDLPLRVGVRIIVSMLEYVCRPIRVCGSAFVLIPVFVRTCMRVVLCAP